MKPFRKEGFIIIQISGNQRFRIIDELQNSYLVSFEYFVPPIGYPLDINLNVKMILKKDVEDPASTTP